MEDATPHAISKTNKSHQSALPNGLIGDLWFAAADAALVESIMNEQMKIKRILIWICEWNDWWPALRNQKEKFTFLFEWSRGQQPSTFFSFSFIKSNIVDWFDWKKKKKRVDWLVAGPPFAPSIDSWINWLGGMEIEQIN